MKSCVHICTYTTSGWYPEVVHHLMVEKQTTLTHNAIQNKMSQSKQYEYKGHSVYTSEQRNSLMEERRFLPSANLEYGVFPDPFSCSSHLSPPLPTTSPRQLQNRDKQSQCHALELALTVRNTLHARVLQHVCSTHLVADAIIDWRDNRKQWLVRFALCVCECEGACACVCVCVCVCVCTCECVL